MNRTDLQLAAAGHTYQWECAILLALNYFFEPVRYNPTLFDLVENFLGQVAEIHLEGKDGESGVDLEDIALVNGDRRILIQVKTKQAEGERWTPSDALLLKALYRFYDSPFLAEQPDNTRFVFLTNRPFNPYLVQVKSAIREGTVAQSVEADKLSNYLDRYTHKEKGRRIDLALFREMLERTALVEYLAIDTVKANVQAKLQAHGRRDWQQAHALLFEYFAHQSTRVGGGVVTRETVVEVLGALGLPEPPEALEPSLERPEPPKDLVEACLKGNCILFAGSGLSVPADFPAWEAFIRDLFEWCISQEFIGEHYAISLRRAIKEGESSFAVDSIVSTLQDGGHEKALNRYLRRTFLKPTSELTETHRLIRRIGFSAVLTTNYDQLLERTYEQPDRIYTLWDTESLFDAVREREFFVLKLKGMLDQPETVLLSPAQYRDAVVDNRAFAQFIASLFVSQTILFLGTSLDDILVYFGGIRLRRPDRRHYALVAVAGSAWAAKADQLQRRYNIQVLPYRVSEPHQELEFVKTLARRVGDSTGPITEVLGGPQPAQLRHVRLENIGPFDELDLELDQQWTILLGDNGVGKSTILRAIALAICGKAAWRYADRLIKFGEDRGRIALTTTQGRTYETELKRTNSEAQVTSLPGRPLEIEGWLALGFPPLRGLGWQQIEGPQLRKEKHGPDPEDLLPLMTGDTDPRINKLKQWIVNLDYRVSKARDSRSKRLRDDFFRVVDRLTEGVTFRRGKVSWKTYQVVVVTDGGEVPIEVLSQGTQSLVGWIGVLLERLYEVYDDADQPRDQYALVLIDEIDAHMHPAWQQSILPGLAELFPNVQLIATTHSPLVVGSARPDTVFRLRRGEDDRGKVTLDKPRLDLRRWRADQVLTSPLFDLDSSMNLETFKAVERYTELAARDDLSDEEKEELEKYAALLEVRAPTPLERKIAREAFERIEEALDEQLEDMPLEKQKKLLEEAKVQIQENVTGSRRPL